MRLASPIIALLLTAAAATAQTVFSSDFEAAMPSAITPGTALLTGVQGFAGLGPTTSQFGGSFLRSATGNVVTLSLGNLPVHDTMHLDFLFAAIDSLDGTGTYPSGDYFKITVDGTTIFREAFANATASQIQTYVPPPGVELARRSNLGFTNGGYYADSAYYLGGDPFFASIAHTATTATISFTIEGPGIQPLTDESWAMDNLRVHVLASSPGTTAAYGTSCGPILAATSIPRIGNNLDLSLANLSANTLLAFAGFGLSSAQLNQLVLPYPLGSLGMPGCWLLQDLILTTSHPFVIGAGNATSTIALPNHTGLVGLQLFAQGWAVTPGANQQGIVFSNGLRVRVGS
jgi:hypothetical protein